MPAKNQFSAELIAALDKAKILGVRSGTDHAYTGIWPVVVDNRVFVRSWNDKPTGWFRAFRQEPGGSIHIGGKDIPVRGVHTRSAKLLDAITAAFARKYNTKASEKWIIGFAEPERKANTLEFVPEPPHAR